MTACPACCSSTDQQLVFTVTAEEAANDFIRSEGVDGDVAALVSEIQSLWGGNQCSVLRCAGCGTRHASPHVGGSAAFYAYAYPPSRNWYPPVRWEHRFSVDRAMERLQPDGRLLEVGAGDGAFIRLLLAAGARPEQLTATEYSAPGRESMERLGVKAWAEDFRSDHFGESEYDVVALFQVLEHLDRLDDAMTALMRLTTPRSSVFISVPNVEEIDWHERHRGLRDMPPNHISTFSLQGLVSLASRHGWQVAESMREPEGVLRHAKRLAVARAFRRRQRPGGLARSVDRIANRRLRRAAMAGVAATQLPASVAHAAREPGRPGEALWVQLRRA
jgi:hypothetical protein